MRRAFSLNRSVAGENALAARVCRLSVGVELMVAQQVLHAGNWLKAANSTDVVVVYFDRYLWLTFEWLSDEIDRPNAYNSPSQISSARAAAPRTVMGARFMRQLHPHRVPVRHLALSVFSRTYFTRDLRASQAEDSHL